ncbi:MAG TPA: hypothetical protein VHW45_02715 [Candidatus Sulfotelmatobacter sp.]|jgi:hypothetical protein|nr:hypothetical protein [Candidatus Sulfotelmatobacter sp.]
MTARFSALLLLSVILAVPVLAKDKNKDKNKSVLPEDILRAQTALVVIDPGSGEPIDRPMANSTARENVEKALSEWGRYRIVMDGERADLIISVRTGTPRGTPTIKGGPLDQRPGVAQGTDSTARIGGHTGQMPQQNDPTMDPQDRGPHMGNEIGPSDDMFTVYRGGISDPLDAPPVWRYISKNCLQAPDVTAVEKFRKAVADSEQPKVAPQQKQP